MGAQNTIAQRSDNAANIQQQDHDDHDCDAPTEPLRGKLADIAVNSPRRSQQCSMLVAHPMASIVKKSASAGRGIFPQSALMTGVVVDDPFAPKRRGRIDVELHTRPSSARWDASCRSGIKADPTRAREICLNPGMSVAGPEHVLARQIVEFAAAEAGHDARRDMQSAQHHCHRTREVLAVSMLAFEEKIRQRICREAAWQFERVSEMGGKILLDSH